MYWTDIWLYSTKQPTPWWLVTMKFPCMTSIFPEFETSFCRKKLKNACKSEAAGFCGCQGCPHHHPHRPHHQNVHNRLNLMTILWWSSSAMPLHIYASGRVCREAGRKGASSRIFLIIIIVNVILIVLTLLKITVLRKSLQRLLLWLPPLKELGKWG